MDIKTSGNISWPKSGTNKMRKTVPEEAQTMFISGASTSVYIEAQSGNHIPEAREDGNMWLSGRRDFLWFAIFTCKKDKCRVCLKGLSSESDTCFYTLQKGSTVIHCDWQCMVSRCEPQMTATNNVTIFYTLQEKIVTIGVIRTSNVWIREFHWL